VADMSLTETVKVSISSPDRFYIGGDWVKPSSSDEIDVINASTEDVFLRVAEAKAEDMDRADRGGSGGLSTTDRGRG
jgi:aldehyde dehydrogenase (NAD+)